jgi:radical SAM superfamily enzyme YgiQ (UPF0313 family)
VSGIPVDILLTHGYFLREDEKEMRVMKPYPPLGILYLSSYLKEKGVAASVYDTTFRSFDEFARFISRTRPPVVGIASNLMTKKSVVRQIAHCVAQGCRVIVGGPDVPEYAEEYVRTGADAAVVGEGEETALALLEAISGGDNFCAVAGIACRDGEGNIVRTPPRKLIADLDSIPFPDRDAIAMEEYLSAWRGRHGAGSVSLICARGCPYACTWCSRSVYGDTHRRRSVKGVVDEIEMIRERYRPDMLWFADDVFTMNHRWFGDFYREMKKRGIRIPFECISRADRLNEEILGCMAEIGAFRIWYGSESGSQRILDAMERKVTIRQIREVTKAAQKFGIQAGLFVMLGYPGEEIGDIDETAEHLKATNPDSFLTTVAYPIKGTKLYGQVQEKISVPSGWSSHSDRELRIEGRYSDRFYWFAHRYLVNEVEHHRMRRNGGATLRARAASFAKARLARAGMALTKGLR